ncbi:MAG: hypothetical protein JWQ70_2276 [Aeromicrobium sp.]|nr:hypothetical protein [Aeromicrobium sp.]
MGIRNFAPASALHRVMADTVFIIATRADMCGDSHQCKEDTDEC